MADPFLEQSVRNPDKNFTSRLFRGEIPEHKNSQEQRQRILLKHPQHNADIAHKTSNQDLEMPHQARLRGTIAQEKKMNLINAGVLKEKSSLSNRENMQRLNNSPEDMTSDSSSRSTSASCTEPRSETRSKSIEGELRQPKGGWIVALRPHYSTISDTIHRIADVSRPIYNTTTY